MKINSYIATTPAITGEVAGVVGTRFWHQTLNPLIEAGVLEMTTRDKPTSSKQIYRLTAEGKYYWRN